MQRFWEMLLGLDRGFLSREGEFSLSFNPRWPGGETIGHATWNVLLVALAVALVVWVYRREGKPRPVRIALGTLRALLLALVIAMLNRPVLTLTQTRVEPSVLAVLIDDSVSMRIRDAQLSPDGEPVARLEAVTQLLGASDARLVGDLARTHQVRMFRFSSDAAPLGNVETPRSPSPTTAPADASPTTAPADAAPSLLAAVASLEPSGQSTRVVPSLRTVAQELQGQRLAGIVLLSDGRDSPAQPLSEQLAQIRDLGVKVYPVPVGTDAPPRNLDVQSVSAQDNAFVGDIVNVRVTLRGSGLPPGTPVSLRLKDANTQAVLPAGGEGATERQLVIDDDTPFETELQFKPTEVGTLDLVVEAEPITGEINDQDNRRPLQIAVLEAKITVLYVDGYPRWEYRYLKNELIRDKTIEVSCLLTSADPTFRQEGDKPITRFPESIEELLAYDVLLLGDVDPRQFTDGQLQLISDFVARRGGGFGMVAGPRFSPSAYRNTVIEQLLPVDISRSVPDVATGGTIAEGFRPVLTRAGERSGVFRFFADPAVNQQYLANTIQPLFWYAKNVAPKPGMGEVYAEHPSDTLPDGRKAPLLVVGRFGAGRTMFSAIDDTWRWRFYTGEGIFNTYWVQTLRYLARGKKLGDRRITLETERPSYELGEQVRVVLRVLDPSLLTQLPEQLRVEIADATDQPIRQELLTRQDATSDTWVASFQADRVGALRAKLPLIASGLETREIRFDVNVPRLELVQPQVDEPSLQRIAVETGGRIVPLVSAAELLPKAIPSAERRTPVLSGQPLWDAPLAMALFVLLIAAEWIARKLQGML
jgi:uncharacterized membrane protein